jgi:hypothetical protein
MKIRWTPAAATDLEQIDLFLKETYPYLHDATMRTVYSAESIPAQGTQR